ncbi:MAG: DUF4251 domain-containing protein [Flavobacteriia bacterium]|nr:DUF4251 domain-containing protein [Flavobacteriia bacterium]OIP45136.1 MAG: hypothetical protein AUK46_13530 [Flavobacteriaceae bacterium CG2_30_31_66]PIV95332.1 MAG: hypothetical protein COW43_14445 [Flavobacteriaceae bacterium CG17_big_fil_post_rev_8_21_14_2_50_31_13]PIX12924.1 MAG: hypothetical protein COZ74_08970 [Flavobacteriaceae bacterium CG_4_8_14_3_um_filter_31_8]PIY13663.1 MAG: hypothetical protein COZ16_13620 [Flavobacteriaceae bacterium CG_4_10_14_3_um_filter_31_253]PIZ11776.1 M
MFLNFRLFFILAIAMLFYNCKSTGTLSEIENFKRVVNEKNFEITATSATPVAFANTKGLENLLPPGSNLANINLINIQNYIKVQNDSLQIALPYYGELQIATAYNADAGINFEGVSKTAKFEFKEQKSTYQINYVVQLKNKIINIFITLFANNRCCFVINSSNRTSITYNGTWKEIMK